MGGAQVTKFTLDSVPSLKGKVVMVTGGNQGIGFGIAKGLVSKGATVVIASRNLHRVMDAVNEIKLSNAAADIHGLVMDVSSFSSIDTGVENFLKEIKQLDVLINNAGILMNPHSKTEQGFEVTLGTNVFGAVYLTSKLLPLLKENENGSRIVYLSSALANSPSVSQFNKVLIDIGGENYSAKDSSLDTYAMSKLLDSMYATELQKRLAEQGHDIQVYGADPGMIKTNVMTNIDHTAKPMLKFLFKALVPLMADTPENGALSSVYAATVDIAEARRGITFCPGPQVAPYKWTTKAYTPENCKLAYDAINSVIAKKGYTLNV